MTEEKGGQNPAGNPDIQSSASAPVDRLPQKGIVTNSGAANPEKKADGSAQLAKDVHWITHATFWSQVGLGLIGLGALWIYHCQLTVMQGQLDQMSKQSSETQKQTSLLQQQLENTNAASVSVQTPGLFNFGQVGFVVSNLGHYVATDISLNAVLTLKGFPFDRTIKVFPPFTRQISRLEPPTPNVDISLQRNSFIEWNIAYQLTDSERSLLETGRAAITASYSYSFNNGFRNIYNTDAGCFGYFKRPVLWEIKTPDGHIQGSGHQEGTYPCQILRKSMDDAVEWECKNKNPLPQH
jgi:hypothetical protein